MSLSRVKQLYDNAYLTGILPAVFLLGTLLLGVLVGFVASLAVGIRPMEIFKESGLATGGDGGLWVNRCLQSISDPRIFGGVERVSCPGTQDMAEVHAVLMDDGGPG